MTKFNTHVVCIINTFWLFFFFVFTSRCENFDEHPLKNHIFSFTKSLTYFRTNIWHSTNIFVWITLVITMIWRDSLMKKIFFCHQFSLPCTSNSLTTTYTSLSLATHWYSRRIYHQHYLSQVRPNQISINEVITQKEWSRPPYIGNIDYSQHATLFPFLPWWS